MLTLKATSFATRQDLAEFAKVICAAVSALPAGETKSTLEMIIEHGLARGDNGVGKWGDPTWEPHGSPICALHSGIAVHNAAVFVTLPHRSPRVRCFVRDASPSGVVDLNPAALIEFGLGPDADIELDGAVVEVT